MRISSALSQTSFASQSFHSLCRPLCIKKYTVASRPPLISDTYRFSRPSFFGLTRSHHRSHPFSLLDIQPVSTRAFASSSAANRMTKIAACQITSTPDVKHNLEISERVVREAAKEGAKVIFLPEAADFITDSAHECFLLSAPISSHTYLKGIQSLSKELQVTILVGIHDLPEPDSAEDKEEEEGSERVFNTQVVVGPDGQIVEVYRKVHLFDVKLKGGKGETSGPNGPSDDSNQPEKKTGESLRIRPGKKICEPVSTVAGKVGLEICYDIRFPEIHSILRDKGAEIIALPSAFTLKTGSAHWATLLKSIAITYQVFVVAAAQVGAHTSSRSSWGETLIFSPWGTELGRLRSMNDVPEDQKSKPLEPEYLVVDLDLGEIDEVRGMIPLEGQRRVDVYEIPREDGLSVMFLSELLRLGSTRSRAIYPSR